MGSKRYLKGRFNKDVTDEMREFIDSTGIDKDMVYEDIWGNEAHLLMLVSVGSIEKCYAREMLNCLQIAKEDIRGNKFELDPTLEDVHLNVESYIIRNCGIEYGGKLHIARSRNDQVVTDVKLRLREEILEVMDSVMGLQNVLLKLASKTVDTIMPGFTHLQHAQPITLGFWATAYVSMLMRDLERLEALYSRVNRSPLGAAALAGTSFKIDRNITAKLMGFDSVHVHALDTVSSRDFVVETFSVLSILMSNLSRMAEDLILWSSREFDFISLPEGYTTGSSIMPQKKNPDAAEMVRGKTGRVYGALMQSLSILKGLPLGYNRDLQEDRSLLWNSLKTTRMSLDVMGGMLSEAEFNKKKMEDVVDESFAAATELANHLVKVNKMSFRESHQVIGDVVSKLADEGKTLRDIDETFALLKKEIDGSIPLNELKKLVDSKRVVEANSSLGGTSPKEVGRMVSSLKSGVKGYRKSVWKKRDKIAKAKELTESEVMDILVNK
ncbi:MAG: argininosuccinate lyase [Candidatus Altiarchaeales archaeon ex4484_2]|nr:MAG: argininosuccinate lyase [Candidatus Altiarchaeales archaeon ex4484_2]